MKATAKITAISPLESGVTQDGREWQKMTIVVEGLNNTFEESYAITLMNDKARDFAFREGDAVTVSFDCKARSFVDRNGQTRWSNELKGWRVERV